MARPSKYTENKFRFTDGSSVKKKEKETKESKQDKKSSHRTTSVVTCYCTTGQEKDRTLTIPIIAIGTASNATYNLNMTTTYDTCPKCGGARRRYYINQYANSNDTMTQASMCW